jgi:2'-5' RNA ligase
MRLFVAIELAPDVRASVAALQERLREQTAAATEVRWVEPANFHLTVKFLGDLPDALLPDVETACREIAQASDAFRIAVRGAGAFPKRGPLKTLWAGLSEGADEWKALVRRAEAPFAPFGVAREGGLAPHVTLGRVKNSTREHDDALRAALAREANTDCGAQPADHLALIRSTLDPRGAIYTTLRTFPLLLGSGGSSTD